MRVRDVAEEGVGPVLFWNGAKLELEGGQMQPHVVVALGHETNRGPRLQRMLEPEAQR